MALSLADELASAFDEPHVGGFGGGISLAEEFGLDLELELGDGFGKPKDVRDGSRTPPPDPDPHTRNNSRSSPARARPSLTPSLSDTSASQDETLDELEAPSTALPDRYNADLSVAPLEDDEGLAHARASTIVCLQSPNMDPLVELNTILTSTTSFLGLLRKLDCPLGPLTDPSVTGRIETALEAHVARLEQSVKLRDVQSKEMGYLLQQLGCLSLEVMFASEDGEALEVLHEQPEDEYEFLGEEEPIGWVGESLSTIDTGLNGSNSANLVHFLDSRNGLDSISDLGPSTPIDTSNNPFDSHPTRPSDRSLKTAISSGRLPDTVTMLHRTTADLASGLSHLTESLQSTSSMSTASARQIRGIRAGIESWRERELAEENARTIVESWERQKLEQGLTGQDMGLKQILEKEVRDFTAVMDDVADRMERIRREGQFRLACAQRG